MNSSLNRLERLCFLFLAALAISTHLARAVPAVTQSVTLRPGWTAVHIEVLPANPALSAIFTDTPIESVWAYENNSDSADFVVDVTEEALDKAGWISWVQTNRVDAFQNDLFQLQVNRAYLVKNSAVTNVTILLSGRPSLRDTAWKPNVFNFRGFPIDPGFVPTFLNFFRPSSAHYAASTGLQPIYRLSAGGAWQLVAPSDLMASGEAYWVFCKGNSQYVAPLAVIPDSGDGIEYGVIVPEFSLTLRNYTTGSLNATITDRSAPAANPLAYASLAADATLTWPNFISPLVRTVGAGALREERFAIRRAAMEEDHYETVLQVIDGAGTRFLIPVTADREPAPEIASSPASATKKKTGPVTARDAGVVPHAGLWLGSIAINGVSEAHNGTLVTNEIWGYTIQNETNVVTGSITTNKIPNSITRTNVSMATTPTGSDFRMRILLHVDATGQTRLLKEVIQMWKNGVATNDLDGVEHVVTPGRPVLVTDDTKINQFSGIASRDGVATGRRVSTVGFDFPENELLMGGSFVEGSMVVTTNVMSASFARNPFKHKYHPDHKLGYDITRVIEVHVNPPPPNPAPDYGDRLLQGVYRETIRGLHRTNIVVTGAVQLTRMSAVATLNQ